MAEFGVPFICGISIPVSRRAFVRRERRLIRTLQDPAWLAARQAEREGAMESPPIAPVPRRAWKDPRVIPQRPPTRPKQLLEACAKLAEPGGPIAPKQLAAASGIPISTVYLEVRAMVSRGEFPYEWALTRQRRNK